MANSRAGGGGVDRGRNTKPRPQLETKDTRSIILPCSILRLLVAGCDSVSGHRTPSGPELLLILQGFTRSPISSPTAALSNHPATPEFSFIESSATYKTGNELGSYLVLQLLNFTLKFLEAGIAVVGRVDDFAPTGDTRPVDLNFLELS